MLQQNISKIILQYSKSTKWKKAKGHESEMSLAVFADVPETAKLPWECWGACFRKSVTNVELHLGWDEVLVN